MASASSAAVRTVFIPEISIRPRRGFYAGSRLLNDFHVAIDAQQFSQRGELPADRTHIPADDVEADFPGGANGETKGQQFSRFQASLDAVDGQPAKTESTAHGVNGRFDAGDRQKPLSGAAGLPLRRATVDAFDGDDRVPDQVGVRERPPQ